MTDSITDKRLSFEFFPAKTEQGLEKLRGVWEELGKLDPEFFSITYGAGGSTRETTFDIVSEFCRGSADVAPHLSFGGDNEEAMLAFLQQYADLGIKRLVALRGDTPSGIGTSKQLVHANELVSFIRTHFGEQFEIEVAAYPEVHPESDSYQDDAYYLKGKIDAGASAAITQLFYNPDAYFYYVDECQRQGMDAPIYPGIMPITNFKNISRFATKSGFDVPRWMRQRFEPIQDDLAATTKLGIETVSRLCEQLLKGGAPGIHFYTMNTTEPTTEICGNLGWTAC
ncbi:MAG: methylenetetrahydrofolate reductase [NAD(P)H] [Pseudomonadota bacterium]